MTADMRVPAPALRRPTAQLAPVPPPAEGSQAAPRQAGWDAEPIPGLAAIAHRYDAFILDMWGVLHDGVKVYPTVPGALRALEGAGKRLAVLSNAPRRAALVRERALGMGVPPLFDAVISSGELAHRWLLQMQPGQVADQEMPAPPALLALAPPLLYLGAAKDRALLDGLALPLTDDPARAGLVVNTGPAPLTETPADYAAALDAALAVRLPMLCCNPDLTVHVGGVETACAGALAADYASRGGVVLWAGKPWRAAFEAALTALGRPDPSRVLMIGDALRTDIWGAHLAGIDAALVPGGIHAHDLGAEPGRLPDRARSQALFDAAGVAPAYVLPALVW